MCYLQVFRRLPHSPNWNMQSITCRSTSVMYLYNTCALNYICLNVQPLEQPDLDQAAPEVSHSIVLIRD